MFEPVDRVWISPTELDYLQGIFDRVCMWCQIDRPSERADRLARYLLHEFQAGVRDETALFEAAMWREAARSKSEPDHEHGKGPATSPSTRPVARPRRATLYNLAPTVLGRIDYSRELVSSAG